MVCPHFLEIHDVSQIQYESGYMEMANAMHVTPKRQNRNLRERRALETREALVAAGRNLFAEMGYAATTVEAISDRAGMTRGAFYKHFPDKDALFEEVVRNLSKELIEHVWGRSYELANNREERERAAARLFVERMSAPDMHRILALDGPAVLGHEQWSHILGNSIFAPLRTAIEGWSNRGLVPEELVEPLTHLLEGVLQAAATRVAEARDSKRAAREYEDALVFLVRSLRGERGAQ